MKKHQFLFIAIYLLSSVTFASNLKNLNQLISTPGFSIEENGQFLTSWKAHAKNRLPGKEGKEVYGTPRLNVFADYTSPSNISIPSVVAMTNLEAHQTLFAELDEKGDFIGSLKCQDSVCATVTKDYCARIYRDFSVQSGQQLVEKISECKNISKMNPQDDEIKALAVIWKHNQDFRTGILDPFPDQPIRNLSPSYKKVAESLDAVHNKVFQVHAVNTPIAKILLIGEQCKAILPTLTKVQPAAAAKPAEAAR